MSGFNFSTGGQQAPATTTAGQGFGGFSFGGSTGGQATSGFSFGAGAPRPPAAGQQSTTATPAAFGGGFGLGAAATTTAPATGTAAGFNFGGAATTKAAAGFGLSAPPPAAQQTGLGNSGFNFGGLGGGQTTTTSTPAPAAGFGLGTPAATASTAAAATTSVAPSLSTGFSGFGMPAATTTSTAAAATSTGASMLMGLLTTSSASTSTPSSTGAAPASFGFGTTPASTAATTPITGAGFSNCFRPPSSSAAPAPSTGFGLSTIGASLGATSTAAPLTSGTTPAVGLSTAGAGAAPTGNQKQMTYRQLEEALNKWTTELEEQEKYFLDQATQVNAWDRIVMDNGEKIIQLNQDVEKVKMDQLKLDHELDFVHSQQRELEELLVTLEKPLDSMPPISYQQHADVEREHTYMLAESLDAQLKRMGQDLKEIIERLNSNNSKPDQDDPVQQITKILNAHVVSLMWVDRNTANLQKRMEDISRQMDFEKREQERNFRLAYS